MITNKVMINLATITALLIVTASGCERDTSGLQPAPLSTDPVVFADEFGAYVDYQAFLNTKYDAVSSDPYDMVTGTASLKVVVPDPGNPLEQYAGGAFTTRMARDLTGYNALTFWAKSSVASTLDVAGLGNDNTGFSRYDAWWNDIELTTEWQRYVIPIPFPDRLEFEDGLFYFAEGAESPQGHTIWFDEIRFEYVGTIRDPRPVMASQNLSAFVGATVNIAGTQVTFNVGGTDEIVKHLPGYFTFASSDETVAIADDGVIYVVGSGTAMITAKLGDVPVTGVVTLTATAPPTVAAPKPTVPAADVLSIFSDAYVDVPVDTWSATWDRADVSDLTVAGDNVKAYTNLVYAGIEFTSETIDATAMTHFHMDVWVPEGNVFRVKLVDFGDDGTYGGAPDSERELSFTASSNPPLVTGVWVDLEIPLADFMGPTGLIKRAHLAQLIVSGDMGTAFVDNIYFHK